MGDQQGGGRIQTGDHIEHVRGRILLRDGIEQQQRPWNGREHIAGVGRGGHRQEAPGAVAGQFSADAIEESLLISHAAVEIAEQIDGGVAAIENDVAAEVEAGGSVGGACVNGAEGNVEGDLRQGQPRRLTDRLTEHLDRKAVGACFQAQHREPGGGDLGQEIQPEGCCSRLQREGEIVGQLAVLEVWIDQRHDQVGQVEPAVIDGGAVRFGGESEFRQLHGAAIARGAQRGEGDFVLAVIAGVGEVDGSTFAVPTRGQGDRLIRCQGGPCLAVAVPGFDRHTGRIPTCRIIAGDNREAVEVAGFVEGDPEAGILATGVQVFASLFPIKGLGHHFVCGGCAIVIRWIGVVGLDVNQLRRLNQKLQGRGEGGGHADLGPQAHHLVVEGEINAGLGFEGEDVFADIEIDASVGLGHPRSNRFVNIFEGARVVATE